MKIKLKTTCRGPKPTIKNNFFKKQFFFIADQNCHTDCTYKGIECSMCWTL